MPWAGLPLGNDPEFSSRAARLPPHSLPCGRWVVDTLANSWAKAARGSRTCVSLITREAEHLQSCLRHFSPVHDLPAHASSPSHAQEFSVKSWLSLSGPSSSRITGFGVHAQITTPTIPASQVGF